MSQNKHSPTRYSTSKEKQPCCVCGKLTYQIDYNYEAYLCSPKCEAFLGRIATNKRS